ncbi:AP-2 complex subunit alpha-2 isoform B [Neolecta irregularis DAH-3]|uniref:AP-2 complex subunit alpha n=1 Tax=Neolecta irregularis (strain DAH-3) TaxID=1198029 RepID=A0A1U7LN05_NEOID|nr:AP-2 complex subunit alpha-2 isoform A [Neolecta irregularis DAH-3]OLL24035.1 AP-2 complex subunit alpha-2 isoform B [Neolecta irregularis DAH-3]|eukprot:OLL24034.1 AP-2 complex subunit alpha-2 isoform A [Neolecta irregularis DAH-3]
MIKLNEGRGLTTFISDLRNARARDLEEKRINKELANIRNGSLSGYQKKKYVCKLLYIYILGWDVGFGHLEAVNLITSTQYSEKQIGYLAISLLLNENDELLHLIVNSIKKDLASHNELHNCMALHAIANVAGREMGEALSADVHQLLISPTSKDFVKKKAALTLLRLYRKYPEIVQVEWAERILSIMDDEDLGVALSVSSLIMALAQDAPEAYAGCYVKATHRLKRVLLDNEYKEGDVYYKVPAPWLTIKMLRLLQYYPPNEDEIILGMIYDVLKVIVESSQESSKNTQQNNAQRAILFEAINLAIHLDPESRHVKSATGLLGKFISAREPNIRYLGLETLAHLASQSEDLDVLKRNHKTVMHSLKDRDISIRRMGLDLLYSMCDTENAEATVEELLKYLHNADYGLREEMVLKIAIITEKFATQQKWYVDTTLQLISSAGNYVSEEVWHRVVQVVVNNEALQQYAVATLLSYLQQGGCHETIIKIGGYLLGEYGHLVATSPKHSPIEQFQAIQSNFKSCSPHTRAMLLSTYVKFINLFPEIKEYVLTALRQYSRSIDPELQQRACEYIALSTMPADDLLQTICEEMPPYVDRVSPLLSRLHSKHAETEDKRTWIPGGKEVNKSRAALKVNLSGVQKRQLSSSAGTSTVVTPSTELELAGLMIAQDTNGSFPSKHVNLASAEHLSPGWEMGYSRLLLQSDGILFEDAQLQIGLRSEYHGQFGRVGLYFRNKSHAPYGSFTITSFNPSPSILSIRVPELVSTVLSPDGQTNQMFHVEALDMFEESPTVRISYLAGALQAVTLKLPIVLTKFMEPVVLSKSDFFSRWSQIGESRESQKILNAKDIIEASRNRKTILGMKWSILEGVENNSNNFVGASVIHTKASKTGCLLRLEPNYETNMFRITVRTTNESASSLIAKLMESLLVAQI